MEDNSVWIQEVLQSSAPPENLDLLPGTVPDLKARLQDGHGSLKVRLVRQKPYIEIDSSCQKKVTNCDNDQL